MRAFHGGINQSIIGIIMNNKPSFMSTVDDRGLKDILMRSIDPELVVFIDSKTWEIDVATIPRLASLDIGNSRKMTLHLLAEARIMSAAGESAFEAAFSA